MFFGIGRGMPDAPAPAAIRRAAWRLAFALSMAGLVAGTHPVVATNVDAVRAPWTATVAAPLFEENVGQFDAGVVASVNGLSAGVQIARDGRVLLRSRVQSSASLVSVQHASATATASRVDAIAAIQLVGSNPSPEVAYEDEAPTRTHYFVGADPAGWHTNVRNYRSVRLRNVYPGVDQVFHARRGKLEFDFDVAPGVDTAAIRFRVADGSATTSADGGIHVQAAAGSIKLSQPVSVEVSNGDSRSVDSRYAQHADGAWSVVVGNHSPNARLTIDPELDFSTFIGGSVTSIAVGPDGSAFVLGSTDGWPLPGEATPPLTGDAIGVDYGSSAFNSSSNVFVMKLARDGQSIDYRVVLGGSSGDRPGSIAIAPNGEAVVGLVTKGTTFPSLNAWRSALPDTASALFYNAVARLAADGSALRYAYYHSPRTTTTGESDRVDPLVAIDSSGRTVVAATGKLTAAVTPAPPPSESTMACGDVILTRTVAANNADDALLCLQATTVRGLAVDPAGFVHVGGSAKGTQYGHGPLSPSLPAATQFDTGVWVSRIDVDHARVIHHTTIGGGRAEHDEARAVAADADGNTYVGGRTTSPLFPLVDAIEGGLTTRRLPTDTANRMAAFLAKVAADGSFVHYSTFLDLGQDSNTPARIDGISSDGAGHVIASGSMGSTATGLPLEDNLVYNYAFVTAMARSGKGVLSLMLLGGRYQAFNTYVAYRPAGELYVAGYTTSPDFIVQSPMLAWNGGVTTTAAYGTGLETGSTYIAALLADFAVPEKLELTVDTDPVAIRVPIWVTAIVPEAEGVLEWYVDGRLARTQPLDSAQTRITFSPGALVAGRHVVRARHLPYDLGVIKTEAQVSVDVLDPEDCP